MSEKEIKGLSSEEVLRSREEYGDNVITPVKKESVWRLFFEKFNDPIIKILLVAAFLSLGIAFVDGHFAETIGIFCAVLLATGVSFWFEYDAQRRFEILNTVNDDTPVKVIRGGEIMEIPKREVVVGDIVVLSTGDEVPADGELIEAISMSINESSLTGEPIIGKTTDPSRFNDDATYPSNMAMRGTNVVEGHGMMRVLHVGDATEFGKVSEQSTVENNEKTPLNKQFTKLSGVIGKIGGGLAAAIFVVMLAKGILVDGLLEGDWLHITSGVLEYFMVAVAIMVMSIPEGLPMSITLSLALSMRRMLKTNNLVRKMHACETMGAVTVICTDKTGTLTRNEMRLAQLDTYGDVSPELLDESIAANTTAFLDSEGKVIGNPTEGALLLWMQERGVDYEVLRSGAKVIDQITFSTERKYMATLVESAVSGERMLYVKGAPEIVLGMSLHNDRKAEIEESLRAYQNRAMRTLGFAVAATGAEDCEQAIAEGRLGFVGVAAISDPVRDDVPAAVAECLGAGINIKIITGDTPATAREIARQIGLWDDNIDTELNHITGVEFEALSDEELLSRVKEIKIMSRARPLDKQRLVRLLQQLGEVVAVTGDGTNDAPALNFANVGLSMGSGTSVAKQASDITLLDDSFNSIATAVMWGRSLYKNIQRFVMFQLTVNLVALVVVLFGSLMGGELPLTVTQILWVNLIMDTFAAMALASLPPNPRVMDDKPRKESDFIINRNMLGWIVGMGAPMIAVLMWMLVGWGQSATVYDMSLFFTVFVMFQVWNLFNAKAFEAHCGACGMMRDSKVFIGIFLAIIGGQILIVSLGGTAFRTVPLTLTHWAIAIAGTASVFLAGELVRLISNRKKRA